MAFSEGLSDTGDLTGRGTPALRGAIAVVAAELVILAWLRRAFFRTSLRMRPSGFTG